MLFTKKKRMNNPVAPRPLPPAPIKTEKIHYSFQYASESSIKFAMIETIIPPLLPNLENTFDFKVALVKPELKPELKPEPAEPEPVTTYNFSIASDHLQKTMMLMLKDDEEEDEVEITGLGRYSSRKQGAPLILSSLPSSSSYKDDKLLSLQLQSNIYNNYTRLCEIMNVSSDFVVDAVTSAADVLGSRISNTNVATIIAFDYPSIPDAVFNDNTQPMTNRSITGTMGMNDLIAIKNEDTIHKENTNATMPSLGGCDRMVMDVRTERVVYNDTETTPGFKFNIDSSSRTSSRGHFYENVNLTDKETANKEDKNVLMTKQGRSLPLISQNLGDYESVVSPPITIPDDKNIIHITYKRRREKFFNKKTTYFVSITTTPKRILNLLENLYRNDMFRNGIHKVIINVAHNYKRFGTDQLNHTEIAPIINKMNARNNYDKYVLHYTEDKGPITKLLGGVQYIRDNASEFDNNIIVVVDDDTNYMNNCIKHLCDCTVNRKVNALYSYSGFKFNKNHEYVEVKNHSQYNECDIVEGFAGISLRCDDVDNVLIAFTNYYYTIDWNKSNTDNANRFLKSCFLGDDMVISLHFMCKNYKMIRAPMGLKSISQNDFGFLDDALHKNSVFLSNMNSYAYLRENLHIYSVFLLKSKICGEIRRMITTHKGMHK